MPEKATSKNGLLVGAKVELAAEMKDRGAVFVGGERRLCEVVFSLYTADVESGVQRKEPAEAVPDLNAERASAVGIILVSRRNALRANRTTDHEALRVGDLLFDRFVVGVCILRQYGRSEEKHRDDESRRAAGVPRDREERHRAYPLNEANES